MERVLPPVVEDARRPHAEGAVGARGVDHRVREPLRRDVHRVLPPHLAAAQRERGPLHAGSGAAAEGGSLAADSP